MISVEKKIEVLDKVITHFEQQGMRAHNSRSCLYRTPNGCKCAIGCLIPDEKYVPEMESLVAVSSNSLVVSALASEGYPVDAEALGWFKNLQAVHDRNVPFRTMMTKYRAMREDLTPPAAPAA